MLISIGICTKNNHQLLESCLESIFAQKLSNKNTSVEILLADSSDDQQKTEELVAKYQRKQFDIKVIRVEERGIIYGRIAIFKMAQGEFLFSTDDDMTLSTDWITRGIDAFSRYPQCNIVAGRILMKNTPPKSFDQLKPLISYNSNFWPFTLYDLGTKAFVLGDLAAINTPSFANMAIRHSLYSTTTLDPRFATQEGSLKVYGGEDPDFIYQVMNKTQMVYIPEMVGKHFVKAGKFTKKYFLKRYWEFGKERALIEQKYHLPATASLSEYLETAKSAVLKLRYHQDPLPEKMHLLFATSYALTVCWLFFASVAKGEK